MEKCIVCGQPAKWKSNVFKSPLCGKCAKEEVKKLLATGKYLPDETAISDFYRRIIEVDANQANIALDPESGLTKIN